MDKFKELFKGKKGKFMIAGIVIVAALALYLRSKSSSSSGDYQLTEYPTYSNGSTSTGTAVSDGVTADQMTEMFTEFEEKRIAELEAQKQTDAAQNAAWSQALSNLTGSTNDALAAQNAAFAGGLKGITDAISGMSSDFAEYQSQMNADLSAFKVSVNNDLVKNATDALKNATQSVTGGTESHSQQNSWNGMAEYPSSPTVGDFKVTSPNGDVQTYYQPANGQAWQTSDSQTLQQNYDNKAAQQPPVSAETQAQIQANRDKMAAVPSAAGKRWDNAKGQWVTTP